MNEEETRMSSPQKTARVAGVLWLLAAATTGFPLVYVRPRLIVSGDAVRTVSNILAFESLFRASIASSVLSQIFFLCLGVTMYRLLRDAGKTLALVCMTSLVVGASIGGINALNNIAALVVSGDVDDMKSFQPDQRNALVMTFIRLNNSGVGLGEVFIGVFMCAFGLFILRSGAVPRVLGVLLIIGACAFLINTFTKILIPQFYPGLMTQLTMIPNAFGPPATMLWLLFKGVEERQSM
jgi:hypothetical protein